ncbi:WD40 repeat domain-containing protein [Helicobacter mesocricetorum]|uniref:WD40 repeat domain-containing protein n=1 Tax=Helicobacter mesocricetorum TaxID=87012 RepID=UPI000CF1172F|nr:hypothetical protein [Helicobacter mesocricetorum]
MFPISKKLKLIGSVLGISTNKTSILCIDNFYSISTFLLENKVIDKYLQLSKKLEPLHHFSKAVAISYETSRIVVGFAKNNDGIVLKVGKNIAPVTSLTWQKLPISNIVFSPKDGYIAVGGEDGRVLVYFGANCQLLTSFPPVSDGTSSLSFSDDEMLLFAASFNKSAFIINLLKNVEIAHIDFDSVIEDAVFYDNDTKIFCITRNGKTIIYDILKKEIINENFLGKYWLTIARKLSNGKFALVGGKDNILHIVSLTSNTLVDNVVLKHTGVTSMFVSGNILYVGYSDGVIEIVNIDEAKEEMLKALEENDLKAAIKIIQEKNVFLQLLEEFTTKVETLWKEILGRAIELLAKDNIDEATKLVEPFMYDRKKREEFDYYWQQKEKVAKFMDNIDAKNYAGAYVLAQQYPYIKNTVAYEELESLWEKCFAGAKKLLIADHKLNFPKAQALLKIFSNVKPKRDIVAMLLNNTDKFLKAEAEYKARNYATYFKICEKFIFLKETSLYKNALYIGEQILQRINALENQANYNKALELCELLASMVPFTNIANEKIKTIENKNHFTELCKERRLIEAFAMIEANYELYSLQECKSLYSDFKSVAKVAFESAVNGDGESVLHTLSDYLGIETFRDKIASLMKIAYLAEFKLHAPSDEKEGPNIDWRETFRHYIQRYGKDEELKQVAESLGLTDVLESISDDGNPKGYLTVIVAISLLSIDNTPLQSYEEQYRMSE